MNANCGAGSKGTSSAFYFFRECAGDDYDIERKNGCMSPFQERPYERMYCNIKSFRCFEPTRVAAVGASSCCFTMGRGKSSISFEHNLASSLCFDTVLAHLCPRFDKGGSV